VEIRLRRLILKNVTLKKAVKRGEAVLSTSLPMQGRLGWGESKSIFFTGSISFFQVSVWLDLSQIFLPKLFAMSPLSIESIVYLKLALIITIPDSWFVLFSANTRTDKILSLIKASSFRLAGRLAWKQVVEQCRRYC